MKCIEFTYEYSMAKHQNVIECSATNRKMNEFPKKRVRCLSLLLPMMMVMMMILLLANLLFIFTHKC